MDQIFRKNVGIKYQIYNSLLLGLPFDIIDQTGVYLPILQALCDEGYKRGSTPSDIINNFFRDYFPSISSDEQKNILFNFIKYIERQVVLFDATEDSAFDILNDLAGDGTIAALRKRINYRKKSPEFKKKIDDFKLHLVLTAHPTQFYPTSVLRILRELGDAIRNNNIELINILLTQLGRTAFLKKQKPTVHDEAVSQFWYLENVFYEAISLIIQELEEFSQKEFVNYNVISVGFWAGGDRDGNPEVNSEVTRQVIKDLRKAIIKKYYEDILKLQNRLSFKTTENLIAEIEKHLYEEIYHDIIHYSSYLDLLKDIIAVRDSLIEEHNGLFVKEVEKVITKVKLFRTHFAQVDIRQDSRIIHSVIEQIVKNKLNQDYGSLSPEQKLELISNSDLKVHQEDVEGEIQKDVLLSILDIDWAQSYSGELSCHRYIISNCKSSLDVMHILILSKWLGANIKLDVVPLFESISDLTASRSIMSELYENKIYKAHLESRLNNQIVMLGFSDGTKDGGYLSANCAIYNAKETITDISRKHKIKLAFFDGRGGPPARGGGNTHRFYSSLGSSIDHNEIQLTIQGQTISSNFGTIMSAKYNMEQLLTAGIENEVFNGDIPELEESQKVLISKLSDLSLNSYLELKNMPEFMEYLQTVGPLEYYGLTNISSRPVKRSSNKKLTLEDLRAIPFVGTWSQIKQNVPAFYGLGTAFQKLDQEGDLEKIKELYKNSQFFRTLIDNSIQVLLKSNFALTKHFSSHPQFGKIWNIIFREFELTNKYILLISGSTVLMDNNKGIRESILLREKIVLPLSTIQQLALQKLNSEELTPEDRTDYQNMVMRSMFGIINAARNSV